MVFRGKDLKCQLDLPLLARLTGGATQARAAVTAEAEELPACHVLDFIRASRAADHPFLTCLTKIVGDRGRAVADSQGTAALNAHDLVDATAQMVQGPQLVRLPDIAVQAKAAAIVRLLAADIQGQIVLPAER